MRRRGLAALLTATALCFPACDDDDDDGGSADAGGGDSPVVESVSWNQTPTCVAGTPSPVEITIVASDPDDDVSTLRYSGIVNGCDGEIDAAVTSLSCPQLANYEGSVSVRDPGGLIDTVMFNFGPCDVGMIMP